MFVNEKHKQKFYFYFIQPLKIKLMKKNYKLMMVSLLFGALTYAQVGVGTATPSAGLDIVSQGNTNATKALEVNNAINTEMVTVLDNGNVGIGNTTPATKLDINNGTTAGAIKIVDGTQGAGRVLTSDANGVGTWSPTPVTSLYFLSSNAYNGSSAPSDFTGMTNPITGVSVGSSSTRYLVNTTGVLNLGPATTYTTGSTGLSYKIPVTGMYRITLYVDSGYANSRITVSTYNGDGTNLLRYNIDSVNANSSTVMINIWQLQAGDVVIPYSNGTPVPNNGQLVETTFTVERVN